MALLFTLPGHARRKAEHTAVPDRPQHGHLQPGEAWAPRPHSRGAGCSPASPQQCDTPPSSPSLKALLRPHLGSDGLEDQLLWTFTLLQKHAPFFPVVLGGPFLHLSLHCPTHPQRLAPTTLPLPRATRSSEPSLLKGTYVTEEFIKIFTGVFIFYRGYF